MEDLKTCIRKYQGKYFAKNDYNNNQHDVYLYIKKVFDFCNGICRTYADAILYDRALRRITFEKDSIWFFGEAFINSFGYKRIPKNRFYQQVRKIKKL